MIFSLLCRFVYIVGVRFWCERCRGWRSLWFDQQIRKV